MPFFHIRHKATGKTALGMKAPNGCVLVQFDDLAHPQAHGWHLYPRHHWKRARNVLPHPKVRQVSHIAHNRAGKRGFLEMQQLPIGMPEAEALREAFREQYPLFTADFSELEDRYEEYLSDGKVGMRPRRAP